MKKILLTMATMLIVTTSAYAQKHDFAWFDRYAKANVELGQPAKGEKRVVFMGNSITEGWVNTHPEFFKTNDLIGRGIGGQTSYQFLLRFREDVIKLQPKIVVINYGTNDIAENTGKYDEELTYGNVISMVEMAKANKIKVILTSCLPAHGFGWNRSITDAMDKIRSLNARVEAYAKVNKITYVDYFSALLSEDGTRMDTKYSQDGVHPNSEGYDVMEALLLPVIKKSR